MERYREEQDSSFTVLDRLLQPAKVVDRGARLTFRDSIARDLEVLLNARRPEQTVPSGYEEASRSILNFGVPELSSFGNLSSPVEQNRLCRVMEEVVRLYEPRLHKVSVRIMESENRESMLRFRLEATIEVLGEREIFEMGFQRDTGEISFLAGRRR